MMKISRRYGLLIGDALRTLNITLWTLIIDQYLRYMSILQQNPINTGGRCWLRLMRWYRGKIHHKRRIREHVAGWI